MELWIRYVASAYGIFALVYGLRFVGHFTDSPVFDRFVSMIVGLPAGALINVLFVVAALSLGKRPWLATSAKTFVVLLTVMFTGTLVEVFEFGQPLHRLPAAALVALSLGWFGLRMFRNIGLRRRRSVASIALAGALSYALLSLVYAVNPIIAERPEWRSIPIAVEASMIDFNSARLLLPGDMPLDALDAFAFGLAGLMKLGLFGGAVMLVLRTLVIISPLQLRKTLRGISEGRFEVLTDKGILAAIAKSMEADLVALCYTQPGRPGLVAWWRWVRPPSPDGSPSGLEIRELPPASDSLVSKVIATNTAQHSDDRLRDFPQGYLPYVEGLNSFITVPIRYHGAVIGALNIEYYAKRAYPPAAVQRVQLLADCLAPAVHSRRQLEALNQLVDRLSRVVLGDPANRLATVRETSRCLGDVLSPLGAAVVLDVGFGHGSSCATTVAGAIEETSLTGGLESVRSFLGTQLGLPQGAVRFRDSAIAVGGDIIGQVVLAIRSASDLYDKPTLADDDLHLQTVAALVADALLEGRRSRFGTVMRQADDQFIADSCSTIDTWFAVVTKTAGDVRFSWVVAEVVNDDSQWVGDEQHVRAIQRLKLDLSPDQLPSATGWNIEHLHMDGIGEVKYVLRLKLPQKRAALWFGVNRSTLNLELKPQWPWRVFLDSFASSAAAALTRLEVQSLQAMAAHDYATVTAAVTTGVFVHELKDVTTSVNFAVEYARSAIAAGAYTAADVDRVLSDVHQAVETLADHTALLLDIENYDAKRPCRLKEAVEHAARPLRQQLKAKNINLNIEVDENEVVDAPFYIVSMSLANLISNSIDAIKEAGRNTGTITIVSVSSDETVSCRVTDDGPGVTVRPVSRVFAINVSTKKVGHGLGLYLTERTLIQHGCRIVVANPDPGETTFAITLPKAPRASGDDNEDHSNS